MLKNIAIAYICSSLLWFACGDYQEGQAFVILLSFTAYFLIVGYRFLDFAKRVYRKYCR